MQTDVLTPNAEMRDFPPPPPPQVDLSHAVPILLLFELSCLPSPPHGAANVHTVLCKGEKVGTMLFRIRQR